MSTETVEMLRMIKPILKSACPVITKAKAKQLRLAREARQLKQVEVAKRLRVSQSTYSKIEKGLVKYPHVTLRQFRRALGILLV